MGVLPSRQEEPDWFTRTLLPFCPAHIRGLSEEERRQYTAVVAFIYIGAAVVFGFANLNLRQQNWLAGGVQYVCVGIILSMLLVNRRGHGKLAAHVCIAMTTVTIFIGMWMGGGLSAAAIVFLPMIPAVGFLSVGRSGGLAGALEAVGIVAAIALLEKLGYQPRFDPPEKLFVKRIAESVGTILQIYVVCASFFRLKQDAMRQLAQKRDEIAGLFDNMRQGVLAFTVDGVVTGQSSQSARRIFGRLALEGEQVADLLYRDAPAFDLGREQFAVWLEFVASESEGAFSEALALAPSACVRFTPEGEQHLQLEFRPVIEAGRLSRIMLLVTDETEQVLFRRAADEQKAAGERALERMRRVAAGGAHAFLDTLRSAELRLEGLDTTLAHGDGTLAAAELHGMFRAAHTVKGDARLYDLHALSDAAERLEHLLGEARTRMGRAEGVSFAARDEARARIAEALAAVSLSRDQLVAASPIGAAILDQVTVKTSDLRSVRQQVMRMHMLLGEQVTPLSEATSRLLSRPFGESASGLSEAVERWSSEQGKRAHVALDGKEVSVLPELSEVLPGVLGHLVRNAVAHGIEAPDARLLHGKVEEGSVRIRCELAREGTVVTVEDDGAGIDVPRLVARAREQGITLPSDPLELMFVDGLSTAQEVDALRGRGVGMSAVRADLLRAGYEIEAQSESGRGTRFVIRPGKRGRSGKAA